MSHAKLIAASELRVGMRVDLQGDKFADPDQDNILLKYEYVSVVADPVRETDGCVAVSFEFDVVGFPPDYQVKLEVEDEYKVLSAGHDPQIVYQGDQYEEAYAAFDQAPGRLLLTRSGKYDFAEVACR